MMIAAIFPVRGSNAKITVPSAMGVLWRKRSLLLKLIVILGTAWFTIAFLLYSDDRNRNRIAEPPNDLPEAPPRVLPFKKETPPRPPKKDEDDQPVLLPPISNAGEMGKPVILPANLSGTSGMMRCSRYGGRLLRTWMPVNSQVAVSIRDHRANPDLISRTEGTRREIKTGKDRGDGNVFTSNRYATSANLIPERN
ncbi:hypothetical protein GEV33_008087 [Tenebrio molitor]|uniref:Uncharacterized protein n=1 Tax=Tenebrio molitor TaxID=7067 RepID=A0A8J6LAF7_TENMO|nr:hypothetical protein GEV33_008087 [Tenebrio molitor]